MALTSRFLSACGDDLASEAPIHMHILDSTHTFVHQPSHTPPHTPTYISTDVPAHSSTHTPYIALYKTSPYTQPIHISTHSTLKQNLLSYSYCV